MNKLKSIFLILNFLFLPVTFLYSEKILLKSGECIDGKITEETDSYLKIKVKHGELEILKTDIIDKCLTNSFQEGKKEITQDDSKSIRILNFIKKYLHKNQRFLNKNKKHFFIAGLFFIIFIFMLKTQKILVSLLTASVVIWYAYYFVSDTTKLMIKEYSEFMHKETYSIRTMMIKERPNFYVNDPTKIREASKARFAMQRVFNESNSFLKRMHEINAPPHFKQFHKEYSQFLAELCAFMKKFTMVVGTKNIDNYKELDRKLILLLKEEQRLWERQRNIFKKLNLNLQEEQ